MKLNKYSILFIFILGLGLSGYLIVEALRVSLAKSVQMQSENLLGAQLSVSATRPFTENEEKLIRDNTIKLEKAKSIEFFSMIQFNEDDSKLILIKAIDGNYPLRGSLKLSKLDYSEVKNKINEQNIILISSDDINYKNSVTLGNRHFVVADTILEDPTQSFRNFALGGRAYIGLNSLHNTKLITNGSTATYTYLFSGNDNDVATSQKYLSENLPADIRITTAQEAAENSAQALAYLSDFLGLISLVALLLSSIGAMYLYKSYLDRKKYEIAVLRALGMQIKTIQKKYTLEAMYFSALALLPATTIAIVILPILKNIISMWSNVNLEIKLYPQTYIPITIVALIGTPLIVLADLVQLKNYSPLLLLRQSAEAKIKNQFIYYIPAILLMCILTPFVTKSFMNAALFLGVIFGLILILLLLLKVLLFLVKENYKSWTTTHAVLLLKRRRTATSFVFITLTLGALLLHLLPQIETSLKSELEQPQSSLPSLFLFDIQEEQKNNLETVLSKLNKKLTSINPLVRARINKVNGLVFEKSNLTTNFKTREEEQEARFKNRGINLSYRSELQASESIVKGNPFSGLYKPDSTQLPEISVETRYARRMGLKIGDKIIFDIQGVEVEGEIINERKVRWTSFQPNFFLLFQDGVLNDAPKTYLANMTALNAEDKKQIKIALAKDFPNVSVIDVAVVINKILELINKMRLALILLASLALFCGFVVLISILTLEAKERSVSLVLFKTLGADQKAMNSLLFKESLFLCTFSVLLGAGFCLFLNFVLSTFIFDGAFAINYPSLFYLSLILILIGLFVSWLSSKSLTKKTPLELLRT